MATPTGPLFAAGVTDITKSGYKITFLPDAHNEELQRAGQPPIFYWMPNEVRLAKKDNNDFKFSMIHFAGVRSTGTTIGATTADDEVAGGVLTFSTISSPPGDVLREAQTDLIAQLRGSGDSYWGLRTDIPPMFRFFPIVSNTTSVSNLSPTQDGNIPASAGAIAPAAGPPAAAPPAGSPPAAAPPGGRALGTPPLVRAMPLLQRAGAQPRTVPASFRGSNIDPMFVRMSGQGSGSINPDAENAYSALLGSIPACIVYNSFHMATGSIVVYQNLMTRVISPMMTIDIRGDWSRVQTHLSAAAHAGGWFWSADLKLQFDSMREIGIIDVKTFVDTSLPNADKMQEYMDKRTDLVFQKFLEQAKTAIFDPAPFKEEAAQAPGGFLGLGGGAAFKLRRESTTLSLAYHETREIAYLQAYPISGTMDGLYDVLKSDPSAEKKYFLNVDLGDWDRKVARIVKPVVNWPDNAQKWVGEPVAFLSAQIGYPNASGAVQWDGHIFSSTDGPGAQWNTATAMKQVADVTNPPAGWQPGMTFVKRQIHFTEPPSALENPFARVQVEQNLVDLDPGDFGSLSDTIAVEVRVDDAGTLQVGPIGLGAVLDAANQIVEVTLQAKGKRADGTDRDPVKFTWSVHDQDQSRFWLLYTGQPGFVQAYRYQVRVLVKGSLFTKGMEWVGPWTDGASSGPMTVSVPTPTDPGVTTRAVPLGAIASNATSAPSSGAPPPATYSAHGPPPTTSGKGAPATYARPSIGELAGWSMVPEPTARAVPADDQVVFGGFVPVAT